MALSPLEQHILAYFIAGEADEFRMDPRWWPALELSQIVEHKVRFAASIVDVTDRVSCANAARALLDMLIARGAFTTSESEYGPMYQFQRDVYRAYIAELRASDPIIAQARADGDDYWRNAFADLTESAP